MSRLLIFSDLSGTLLNLDSRPDPEVAPIVRRVIESGAPIVFCSSKTFGQQRAIQNYFNITMPCILENGSAIALPDSFWSELPAGSFASAGWRFIVLGLTHYEVRRRIQKIEAHIGESLWGIGSMESEDVASLMKLDLVSARHAQLRGFSEMITVQKPDSFWEKIDPLFAEQELSCTQIGKFRTVASDRSDKGTAIQTFMGIHRSTEKRDDFLSIGVSAGSGDRELLAATDVSYQVMNQAGVWAGADSEEIVKVHGVGAKGWASAVKSLMEPERCPQKSLNPVRSSFSKS